jgi:hypothetical protein
MRLERVGHLPAGQDDDPFLSLAVEGKFAYLIQGNVAKPKRLQVVDVSDPARPRIVGTTRVRDQAMSLAVSGTRVYVLDEPNLRVFDVADPASPREMASCRLGSNLWDLAIQGRYAYITNVVCMFVVDLENPTSPRQVGRIALEEAQGIAVQGKYAYIASNIEGLAIVDISNPNAPREVGRFRGPQGAADVVAVGKHAYIVGGEDAVTLWIADVTDPQRPTSVGKFGDWIQGSIAMQGNYVYLAGGDLDMVDVSKPATPRQVGSFSSATHVTAVGTFVYVASSDGLSILRPTTNPQQAGDPN